MTVLTASDVFHVDGVNDSNDKLLNDIQPVEHKPADDVSDTTVESAKLFYVETSTSLSTIGNDAVVTTDDPWILNDKKDTSPPWSELGLGARLHRVFVQCIGKLLLLLALLYFFVCSLDLLSSAFRLLGGRAAGAVFKESELLGNPVAGLMIGVLATVLVQSSSTSSSIIVTMVASGLLPVQKAIPIIMGANIGTSVTNTVVSLAQSPNRDEFRLAFAGATVHDMFNWLSVIVLLPVEVVTGYLFHVTSAIVDAFNVNGQSGGNGGAGSEMLKVITKPFTERIIQLDKNVIESIATNDARYADKRLMKEYCVFNISEEDRNVTKFFNMTDNNITWTANETYLRALNVSIPVEKCEFLFNMFGLNDTVTGMILLVISLVVLCGCLVLMVKVLNSALHGSVMTVVKKVINANLPGRASYFSGYIAMLVGAGMTILVQSSSVFTSALTPLVGVGVVSLERMYPLTLGSNIGTTTTGLLAAMAASDTQLRSALQIALVHLCFNISGILLFYPIPQTRFPIILAKMMGNTTAKYRWFAVFYVVLMFFLLPLAVFSLSMIHTIAMLTIVLIFISIILTVAIINVLQHKRKSALPKKLQNWDFLPLWMHSLKPLDQKIMTVVNFCRSFCWCASCRTTNNDTGDNDKKNQDLVIIISADGENKEQPTPETDNSDCALYRSESKASELSASEDRMEAGKDTDSGYKSMYISQTRKSSLASFREPTTTDETTFALLCDTPCAYECESGYASMTTTPHNTPVHTPCVSRLPSFARIPESMIVEEDDNDLDQLGSNSLYTSGKR